MSSSAMRHSNDAPRSGSGAGVRQRGNPFARALGVLLLLGLLAAGLAGYLALPAPAAAQTPPANHDSDGDGLIEISNLAQLNAVRWNLNGNGVVRTVYSDNYAAAFPVSDGGSVCPSGVTCTGYELTADLDFDTGTAGDRTDDDYYHGGAGWVPIGSASAQFTGVFDGGSHTIANLHVNHPTADSVGLFGYIGSGGEVRSLGLTGVDVTGKNDVGGLAGDNTGSISASYAAGTVRGSGYYAGGLVGENRGTISASYATGEVSGANVVGGLAGYLRDGTISRSYATAVVSGTGPGVGGLVGSNEYGTISASYATGAVSGTIAVGGLVGNDGGTIRVSYAAGTVSGTQTVGGLAGYLHPQHSTVTASYHDSEVSGRPVAVGSDDTDNSGAIDGTETATAGAEGKTTSELQSLMDYTGIYSNWNLDLDNADGDNDLTTGGDDPWDFGTNAQYPVLKADFNGDGQATWQEFVPAGYDSDGDGLIEISTLAQLNAVRYDLDGDGVADSVSNNDAYAAAFPVSNGVPVCPRGNWCRGYELTADLDFDENDDRQITSADAAWWNGGGGWDPIGIGSAPFSATFEGNRHTISHLYINRSGTDIGLFHSIAATGEVRNLGLEDVSVRGGDDRVGALVGTNRGTISGASVTGTVSGDRRDVGGLAGYNHGTISESYSAATVNGHQSVGGLSGTGEPGSAISKSYATGAVSSSGSGSGGGVAGGLAGWSRGTISESYAAGAVSGDNRVGGLVGLLYPEGSVKNSYALGEVKQTGSSTSSHGGLVGSRNENTTIQASYYNTSAQNIPGLGAVGEGDGTGAAGHTGQELAAPTGYAGIYETWDDDSDVWDFGTDSQYPALKADFDGDNTATWQEFGYQVRQPLPLTATPSHDLKALLSWPDITEPAWTKTPQVSYVLYRDGTAVTDYDGSSRSHTDAGLTNRQEYTYQVALLLDGAEVRRSKAVSMTAKNRPHFGQAAIDNQVYMENTDIGTLTLPEATGGDGTPTYTLTPEPPAGLSFDADARTISGTPTEPQDATEYTYTATDGDGETAELTFTIEVEADLEPTFGEEAIDNQVYTQSIDIGTVNLPAATGGDGTPNYTLTPNLPAGLSFDPADRSISGTPTAPQDETEYTYTVADADGDEASLTFTIEVEADLTPPVLTPVELVMSPTNDNTPSVVFISSEPGTLVYGGDCGNPTPSEITTADTETTLTYPQLADGKYSGCSVAITDAAGNTGYPAVHPDFWDIVVDTQAPTLESAVVAHPFGDIVLRFSEEISWFHQPDTGAFQVFVDGEPAEVQFIAIGWEGNGHDQREVLLELSLSVPEGAEVVVNYHHVDTLSPLQDHAGNLFPSGRYEVGQ